MEKKSPIGRKLFSPTKIKVPGEGDNNELANNGLVDDEDMSTTSFNSDGESSLQINWNVVSVLPHEYDQVTEVEDSEEADELKMTKHKPVCYCDTVGRTNCFFGMLACILRLFS